MKLKCEGIELEISPHTKVNDEDWVKVSVFVRVAGFEGSTISWLQLEDIRRFSKELRILDTNLGLEKIARLCSAEPDIDIQLKSDKSGRIDGEYHLESERRDGIPTVLSGAFNLDQSYLPSLIKNLKELIESLE